MGKNGETYVVVAPIQLRMCCNGYNHTQKNFPAPISELPLKSSLDDFTHSGSLCELARVLTSTLLVHCIQVSTCGCLSHACDHVLVMLKVFDSYVLVVFAMKASVVLTHGVTFTVAQASSQSMSDQS